MQAECTGITTAEVESEINLWKIQDLLLQIHFLLHVYKVSKMVGRIAGHAGRGQARPSVLVGEAHMASTDQRASGLRVPTA